MPTFPRSIAPRYIALTQVVALALLGLFILSLILPAQSDSGGSVTSGWYAWMMSFYAGLFVPEIVVQGGVGGLLFLYMLLMAITNLVLLWTLIRLVMVRVPGSVMRGFIAFSVVLAWGWLLVPMSKQEPFLVGFYLWCFVYTGTAALILFLQHLFQREKELSR